MVSLGEGSHGNNSRGDRLGFRHRRLQEGLQTFPGAAAQLNQQLAIMQEEAAEDLGDRKNPMPVRDGPEHMTAEPLAELHGPFLSTAWAEFPFFTREREDSFRAAGIAANAGKTLMEIPAK